MPYMFYSLLISYLRPHKRRRKGFPLHQLLPNNVVKMVKSRIRIQILIVLIPSIPIVIKVNRNPLKVVSRLTPNK